MGLQTGLVAVILWLQAEWGEEKEDKEQKKKKTQELIKKVLRAAPEGRAQGVLERR